MALKDTYIKPHTDSAASASDFPNISMPPTGSSADQAPSEDQTMQDSSPDVLDLYDTWLDSIKYYIEEACIEYGIESPTKATQPQFNALLTYAGRRMFKGSQALLDKTKGYKPLEDKYNSGSLVSRAMPIHYDIDKLYILLKVYIYLCDMYDKAITLRGFGSIGNISFRTIWVWEDSSKRLSNEYNLFTKAVKKLREESLSDILTTGKRQPIGIITVLNHEYNWASPTMARDTGQTRIATAEELPSLKGYQKATEIEDQRKSVVEIAQRKEDG